MAALGPERQRMGAIHGAVCRVDGRVKPGHDMGGFASPGSYL